jgi:mannose-1-phosphate guanylyltransferase
MRAILLAAGLGTRLRPITDTIPKCLVPIQGRPLLGHWLASLREAGVDPILINTHHHAGQVRKYIENRTDRRKIKLVFEPKLLGTGGTIRANAGFGLDEPLIVIHADNYCRSNICSFIQAHNARPDDAEISMLTFESDMPTQCGIVEVDNQNLVTGFYEKVADPPGNLANGAVYIFEPSVVEFISDQENRINDLSLDLLPQFIGRIFAWSADGIHIDIGTHKNYEKVK